MDCRAVERNLSLYIDGELESKGRLAIEVHLRRCAPCQAAFRQLSSIQKCLGRTRKQVKAPEDFTSLLQMRLRQLESRAFLTSERTTLKLRRTMMLTAVGAAILMAAGLFALLALVQQSAESTATGITQWRPGRAGWDSGGSRFSSASAALVEPAGSRPVPVEVQSGSDQKPITSVTY
jgi:anti-sigma factor RsiW